MKIKQLPKTFTPFVEELESLFGMHFDILSVIEVDSYREMKLVTGQKNLSKRLLGCSRAGIIVIYSMDVVKKRAISMKRLEKTIKHELVHVFYQHKFKTASPKWLNEGLAIYLSGQKYPPIPVDVHDLIALFSQDAWKKDPFSSYQMSYELVKRMLESNPPLGENNELRNTNAKL